MNVWAEQAVYMQKKKEKKFPRWANILDSKLWYLVSHQCIRVFYLFLLFVFPLILGSSKTLACQKLLSNRDGKNSTEHQDQEATYLVISGIQRMVNACSCTDNKFEARQVPLTGGEVRCVTQNVGVMWEFVKHLSSGIRRKTMPVIAQAFEETRTPYASGREICVKKFGNAYQQNRETNGAFQKPLYHHQTIQRNTEMLCKRCALSFHNTRVPVLAYS